MRNLIFLVAISLLGVGCASVKSTAAYYTPYTTRIFPPKPPKAPIPILGKAPPERYTAIGRLAFSTPYSWRFLRASMVYNAQVNGADAVILKDVSTRRETSYSQVPPSVEWVPVENYYQNRKGCGYRTTNWIPFFQPGYTQQYVNDITTIDAEMIVLKK